MSDDFDCGGGGGWSGGDTDNNHCDHSSSNNWGHSSPDKSHNPWDTKSSDASNPWDKSEKEDSLFDRKSPNEEPERAFANRYREDSSNYESDAPKHGISSGGVDSGCCIII